jgi:hypothetical protein
MQHTEELWVCMVTVSGAKDGRRYITVHNLCSSLSNITCQILPSLHALTGCDTTSAFVRIGKKYAYKILKTSTEELSDLVSLNNADRETTIFMQQDMHYLCISYHLYHQTQSPCIPTALLCAASVESRAHKEPKHL